MKVFITLVLFLTSIQLVSANEYHVIFDKFCKDSHNPILNVTKMMIKDKKYGKMGAAQAIDDVFEKSITSTEEGLENPNMLTLENKNDFFCAIMKSELDNLVTEVKSNFQPFTQWQCILKTISNTEFEGIGINEISAKIKAKNKCLQYHYFRTSKCRIPFYTWCDGLK